MSCTAREISVVIVTFNACADLERCLRSLESERDVIREIIVFDNGSTDGTGKVLESSFPEVHVISSADNVGLTAGINRACRIATGEHICLLDSDTVVEPGALSTLRDFLLAHPGAGTVSGRMLNPDGSIQETARSFPSVVNGLFGRQTLLARAFPNNPLTRSYLRREDLNRAEPFEVDWVAAACMMFPRDLLATVGHWDEDFFVYWVDADWCIRVRRSGRSVWCVPAARIFHIEQNRAGRRKSPRGIRSFHEGAYLFYRKHYVRSAYSPMAQLARVGLAARCRLLLLTNSFKR